MIGFASSSGMNGIARTWPVRSTLCTLVAGMGGHRMRTPARTAVATAARLGALSLITMLPLAAFSGAESSFTSAVSAPQAAQAPVLLRSPETPPLDVADLPAVEAHEEAALTARVVVSIVVTDDAFSGPPSPPEPAPVEGLSFWTGGDSTATYMSLTLVKMFDALGAEADTYYQGSTGLSRPDYFDWPQKLRAVIAASDPDIAVFMVGANDSQPIRNTEGVYQQPFTAGWKAEYARRVGAVMDLLAGSGRHVVYVGQANMGTPRFASWMFQINEIIESEANERKTVGYIDAWALFSDAYGEYQAVLLDEAGVPTLYRAGDGIHFTFAGGERLADAVFDEVDRLLAERPDRYPLFDFFDLLP